MTQSKAVAIGRVGQVLKARYRIDRVLHVGDDIDGAGPCPGPCDDVYAGTDLKGGRVAIKCLRPEASSELAVRARWIARAYLANSIGHPGAISVLDDGCASDGSAFVVMELLEGQNLDELRQFHNERGGRLPTRLVCAIADQCLDLLDCAHAQDVAHGGLTPSTMFWTRSAQLKVIGFGSASPCPNHAQHPEGCGLACAMQSDLRAVAAAVFLLLRGQTVEVALAEQPGATIASLLPSVPAAIALVIERALGAQSAEAPGSQLVRTRPWTSAREMRAALQLAFASALGGHIERAMQPMAANVSQPPPTAAWVVVAILAAALVAWSAWWPSATPNATPRAQAATETEPDVGAERADQEAQPAPARATPAAPAARALEDEPQQGAPQSQVLLEPPSTPVRARGPAHPDLRLLPSSKFTIRHRNSPQPTDQLCAHLNERRSREGASPEVTALWTQHCGPL